MSRKKSSWLTWSFGGGADARMSSYPNGSIHGTGRESTAVDSVREERQFFGRLRMLARFSSIGKRPSGGSDALPAGQRGSIFRRFSIKSSPSAVSRDAATQSALDAVARAETERKLATEAGQRDKASRSAIEAAEQASRRRPSRWRRSSDSKVAPHGAADAPAEEAKVEFRPGRMSIFLRSLER